jgi:hypothetical protein
MKQDYSKLIIASLKAGKEMKVSQRDWLTISQYAENIGLKLEVVKKDGLELVVKAI